MLRKLFIILTSTAVILSMSAAPSFCGRYFQKRHFQKKNFYAKYMRHSHKAVLHMYLIDENREWTLTRRAPRGRMKYNLWGEMFNFTFKGRHLSPDTPYTLLYYKENAVSEFIQLGEGLTDRRGRIYFENTFDICSMPAADDSYSDFGARILLVPSDSVFENAGYISPDPNTFLEGSHLIRFFDTNGCFEPEPDDDWADEDPVDEETGGGDSVITEPPADDELGGFNPPLGGDPDPSDNDPGQEEEMPF